eukprot:3266970-Rhodomonas_salina.1
MPMPKDSMSSWRVQVALQEMLRADDLVDLVVCSGWSGFDANVSPSDWRAFGSILDSAAAQRANSASASTVV